MRRAKFLGGIFAYFVTVCGVLKQTPIGATSNEDQTRCKYKILYLYE